MLAEAPVERLVKEVFKGTQPCPFVIENSALSCAFNVSEMNRMKEVMMVLITDPLMVNGRSNVKAKYAAGEVSQKLFYIFKRILSIVSDVLFRQ